MPGPRASEGERKEQILEAARRIATKDGLERLSTRAVASEAGLSHGLVFFHFRTRDVLLVALLDWMLERTMFQPAHPEIGHLPSAMDCLLVLLRSQIARLPAERANVELFFDYWVRGTRHPEIRRRIRRALQRYRAMFRPLTEEVLREAPDRFPGVTAEGLAAVVVGFIQGCAMQAVVDANNFDVDQFVSTAEALVGQLATT